MSSECRGSAADAGAASLRRREFLSGLCSERATAGPIGVTEGIIASRVTGAIVTVRKVYQRVIAARSSRNTMLPSWNTLTVPVD